MERAAVKALYPKCEVVITHDSDEWFTLIPGIKDIVEDLVHISLSNTTIGKVVKQCEVSVILSNNEVLRTLNREYRNKDKATNVLSFPSYALMPDLYDQLIDEKEIVLGDVLLAIETIKEEAVALDVSLQDHVSHLLVHGILHLLGYDHMDEDEAKQMEELEVTILKQFGIKSPYEVMEN